MMRSRLRGGKVPCHNCNTPTMFEYEQVGKRGAHIRWLPTCVPCGERPALLKVNAA